MGILADELLEKMKLIDEKQVEHVEGSILTECITRLKLHHHQITDLFASMYYDVHKKISPAQFDLSFFRSRPYFEQLDNSMGDYLAWHKTGHSSIAGKTEGGTKSKLKTVRSLKKKSSKGFGK